MIVVVVDGIETLMGPDALARSEFPALLRSSTMIKSVEVSNGVCFCRGENLGLHFKHLSSQIILHLVACVQVIDRVSKR